MKILHTSDWHLGKQLEGSSRLEEQEQFLSYFVALCEQERPDLILLAGDVYDTVNPPARAEKLFYDTLKRLSRGGACMTLVIAGNHDNPERLVASGPLAMEHGIVMLGTPRSVASVGAYGNHRVLRSGEGFVEIEIGAERAVILAVPYPSEKRLGEVLYKEQDEEADRSAAYADKLAALFDTLAGEFRKDTINLTVSHLFAFGSEPSGSERASSLGGSYLIPTSVLPQQAQYTALGHIHKPQVLPKTMGKMVYSGSPIHYSRSEPSTPKRIYRIEVRAGEEARIDALEIPIFKPIEVWQCSSIDDAIARCTAHQGEESWVYLEIQTDRYIREDEIKQMKALKSDLLEIRPIFAKSPEAIAHEAVVQMGFMEQFAAYYEAQRGSKPAQELLDTLERIWEEEDADETGEA